MSEPSTSKGRPWTLPAALVAVFGFHFALLAWFAPPRVLFSKEPVVVVDYALHAYQVDRALTAFRGSGALWGWDPLVLAGQPAGVAEDLTSKGTELFVIGLRALGIHAGLGFNLFIVLVMSLVPFVGYASARLFGLDRRSSGISVALWILLWYFDSLLHWTWWIGMISWSFAAYGAVLFVALFHRALEEHETKWFAALVALTPALAIVHPFAGIALLVPGGLMYFRARKTLGAREHALVWLAFAAGAATALIWIFPAYRFKHYVDTADSYFNARLEYLLYDLFDLLKNSDHTGAPVRTLVRTLCFAAGGVTLWRWHKLGDRRVLPLASLCLWGITYAYLASYTNAGRQTQPYRQIAPAMLAAAIPAGALLSELFSRESLRRMDKAAKLTLALALVLIVPRFVRTVLFFMPGLLPIMPTAEIVLNEPKPFGARLSHASPEAQELRAWLIEHAEGSGRIVVRGVYPTHWVLAEYLAASTRLPILGGLEHRNVHHADAHLFRRARAGNLLGAELQAYFDDYAVGWVVLAGEYGFLDYRQDVLELVATVAEHRIYRVRQAPSYFLRGAGRVTEQAMNRIKVEDVTGDEVVLRFHWFEPLVCRPDCVIERFPIAGDRVGFIRVPRPPPSFEIVTQY
ncbi:MAG: hypothetical protein IPI67_06885 [Myxococcales bacterium]|nr:hypothetical protein [Myxococcales bacterium]